MADDAEGGLLTYDGTTYRLPADVAADLLARGIIVLGDGPGVYGLDPHHVIDEIEAMLAPIERSVGDEVRGEDQAEGRRRLAAVRFAHRSGRGGV
jgi:hypothetical protein